LHSSRESITKTRGSGRPLTFVMGSRMRRWNWSVMLLGRVDSRSAEQTSIFRAGLRSARWRAKVVQKYCEVLRSAVAPAKKNEPPRLPTVPDHSFAKWWAIVDFPEPVRSRNQ